MTEFDDDAIERCHKLWPLAFDRSLPDEERLTNLRELKALRDELGRGMVSVFDMHENKPTPLVGNIEEEIARLES